MSERFHGFLCSRIFGFEGRRVINLGRIRGNVQKRGEEMKIVVIGGGASGMAAAIMAARQGAEVVLFEKEERVGRKLLATGNGKCNYSNENCDGTEYYSADPSFVKTVLERITQEETLEFFKGLGIWPRVESEGRIYPSSEQAASVVDVLRMEVEHLEIEVICEHWIKGIIAVPEGRGFNLVSHQNKRLHCDKVIVACGGMAGGQYGCSGDGYFLAEALGHTYVEPQPALVQLTSEAEFLKQLKGVRAKGRVTLLCGEDGKIHQDKKRRKGLFGSKNGENGNVEEAGELQVFGWEDGEIQFTEHGLSGICVFNLSGEAMRRKRAGAVCKIRIDLFPQMEREEFRKMMRRRLQQAQYKTAEDFLNGLIHKKLIVVVLKQCGIEKMNGRASDISQEKCDEIADFLKNWQVEISGARSWNEAQTTTGGISLSEIDPNTMESKLKPGLYFAGEVVAVDGRCGGYNLQWAWSSGILAGKSAAGGSGD